MSLDPASCKHRALEESSPGLLKVWAKLWCSNFNAKTLKLKRVLEVDWILSYLAKLASGPFIPFLSMEQQNLGDAAGVGREWGQLQPSPITSTFQRQGLGGDHWGSSSPSSLPQNISCSYLSCPKTLTWSSRSPQCCTDSACSGQPPQGFCAKEHLNTCKYCKLWCFIPTLKQGLICNHLLPVPAPACAFWAFINNNTECKTKRTHRSKSGSI